MSSLLALVPSQQEGLVVPLMDARRNNVYAGFYENAKPVMPEAHLSFAEVLEKVKDVEQVTFVGEVGAFVEQIQEQLPQASYQETLPNAANLALWAWDKEADSLHDFVPNYLKRVEAEENWLKNHTESGAVSYTHLDVYKRQTATRHHTRTGSCLLRWRRVSRWWFD